MPAESRLCWVVTDGRRGIENQALGLAEAVGRLTPLTIARYIAPPPDPLRFRDVKLEDLELAETAADAASQRASPEAAPDLWIACGRASLPYSERARGWFDGKAFVVQVQDPKRPLQPFDLVVPPLHDKLQGPNVFPILGSPNRITEARLEEGRRAFDANPSAPPSPRAVVLVGGGSRRHRMTPSVVDAIVAALEDARAKGVSLLITTSRRTPELAALALKARFHGDPGVWLWTDDADGPNPYDAFLAAADIALVTKDSTNMITEAASAGLPVLLLPMGGEDGKFAALYAELERRGAARSHAGSFEPWGVTALTETERAAAEVLRRATAAARGSWREAPA